MRIPELSSSSSAEKYVGWKICLSMDRERLASRTAARICFAGSELLFGSGTVWANPICHFSRLHISVSWLDVSVRSDPTYEDPYLEVGVWKILVKVLCGNIVDCLPEGFEVGFPGIMSMRKMHNTRSTAIDSDSHSLAPFRTEFPSKTPQLCQLLFDCLQTVGEVCMLSLLSLKVAF